MFRRATALRSTCTLSAAINSVEKVWGTPGWKGKPLTKDMNFHDQDKSAVPMFHVLSMEGAVENPQYDPNLSKELAQKIMTTMVTMNAADRVLLEAQRQGRISFYMTCTGEEGESTASVAALNADDMVYMQYREAPVMMYRGWGVQQMISQCMGNIEDKLKGRQMPIHYGDADLNIQMVSSPLCTQVPHAAGTGYAYKLDGKGRICICYLGEGAASEGDFHAGLNFASTVKSNTLFFVRNNGFAISTPASDQYAGDGILPRGIAYGIPSIRVDGNDVLAVYAATKKAREIIVTQQTPVLIETMSYRVGHHSTSDDSTAYRQKSEISHFDTTFSPIKRFGKYLEAKGWWSEDNTKTLQDDTVKLCMSELRRQESLPPHPIEELFNDTFAEMTPNLKRQKEETMAHYHAHKSVYDAAH